MGKTQVPAFEGWFTMDAQPPRLLGSRCKKCKSYFFPKELLFCRNPGCAGNVDGNFDDPFIGISLDNLLTIRHQYQAGDYLAVAGDALRGEYWSRTR